MASRPPETANSKYSASLPVFKFLRDPIILPRVLFKDILGPTCGKEALGIGFVLASSYTLSPVLTAERDAFLELVTAGRVLLIF